MEKTDQIGAFIDSIASTSPTPGGGGAACLVMATGISLIIKSYQVSLKRDPELKIQLGDRIRNLRNYLEQCYELARKDAEYYQNYLAAYRSGFNLEQATLDLEKAMLALFNIAELILLDLTTGRAFVHRVILSDFIAGQATVCNAGAVALLMLRETDDEIKKEKYNKGLKRLFALASKGTEI